MSRVHVVLDPSSVPIYADLVGFFHGGPLDQAWIFDSPTDQWIALTEDHPDINVAGFNWFDHPLDGSKVLRISVIPPIPVKPLSEPISPTVEGEVHTYHLHNFRSSFGDVAVYRLAGTERPTELPSSFARAARTRARREPYYDSTLGRFPGDDTPRRPTQSGHLGTPIEVAGPRWRDSRTSDPLSDVMEARRRIIAGDCNQEDQLLVQRQMLARWGHLLPRPDIGSSTACFECGATVKTEHVWLKKSDPNIALCEGCFRTAETAGRVKEGNHTDDSSSALA